MRALILFVFLATPVPAAAPPELLPDVPRINDLIKQLDADDFRTRDRATRELRQIGFPALEPLKRAAASPSTEMRERAEQLAREIRFASFPAGKPAEGMRATLRADREVFRANEPISMQLEIKNVGATPLGIPTPISWSFLQTHGPGSHTVRGLFVPSHAHIQVHQFSGPKPVKNLSPIACGGPGRLALTPVKVGEAVVIDVPVTMVATLTPGDYEVRVTFQTIHVAKDFKPPTLVNINAMMVEDGALANTLATVKEHALISNTVRFTVE